MQKCINSKRYLILNIGLIALCLGLLFGSIFGFIANNIRKKTTCHTQLINEQETKCCDLVNKDCETNYNNFYNCDMLTKNSLEGTCYINENCCTQIDPYTLNCITDGVKIMINQCNICVSIEYELYHTYNDQNYTKIIEKNCPINSTECLEEDVVECWFNLGDPNQIYLYSFEYEWYALLLISLSCVGLIFYLVGGTIIIIKIYRKKKRNPKSALDKTTQAKDKSTQAKDKSVKLEKKNNNKVEQDVPYEKTNIETQTEFELHTKISYNLEKIATSDNVSTNNSHFSSTNSPICVSELEINSDGSIDAASFPKPIIINPININNNN